MTNTTKYIPGSAKVALLVDIENYGGIAFGDLTEEQQEIMELLDDEGYVQMRGGSMASIVVRSRFELTDEGLAHLARWRALFAPRSTNLVGEALPGER